MRAAPFRERRFHGGGRSIRCMKALRVALALIPPIMLTFAIPFVNRVEPRLLGLPFLLAWIIVWMLIGPAFYWAIYRLERRA